MGKNNLSVGQPEDSDWINWTNMMPNIYDENNDKQSFVSRIMGLGHSYLENSLPKGNYSECIEIGAGTGIHLKYIKHKFKNYLCTDSNPRMIEIAKNKHEKTEGVAFKLLDGGALPFADGKFDRLIATHCLEHIPHPHLALKEFRRVVRPGGTVSILIPTDPGIAWRLGQSLGPRRSALKAGIPYDYIMAREHVNSCINLIRLCRYYFGKNITEGWWPFRVPSTDANLFYIFHGSL